MFGFCWELLKCRKSRTRRVPPVTQPDIPAPSIQDASPTKRALLIGISKYLYLPPNQQLSGCTNDVALLNGLLLEQFGFSERNISRLCDKQATREGILTAFEDLIAATKENDVVVIHYSGHGSCIQDTTKG